MASVTRQTPPWTSLMPSVRWVSSLAGLLLVWVLLLTPATFAQHGGGGGGGGAHGGGLPGGPPGSGGAEFGPGNYRNNGPPPGNAPDSAGTVSTMRGGLQLGPPGRWWDDKHFARNLKLRTDQQHRMDGIFEANRAALAKHLEDVQQQENRLEALVHAHLPDEGALDTQIERRSQARADLEKAYTHYLLQIRNEMDADQLARLEDHR